MVIIQDSVMSSFTAKNRDFASFFSQKKWLVLSILSASIMEFSGSSAKALNVPSITFNDLSPVGRNLEVGISYSGWNITNNSGLTWSDFHFDCRGVDKCTFSNGLIIESTQVNIYGLSINNGETFDALSLVLGSGTTLTVPRSGSVQVNPTVPAPLPVLGLFATFGYTRRLKSLSRTLSGVGK